MCGYMASNVYYSSQTQTVTCTVPTNLLAGSRCAVYVTTTDGQTSNTNNTYSVTPG